MKTKHLRKLLQLYQACGGEQELTKTVQNVTSSPLTPTPPPQPPSALDSTMALTIFILLVALFFMGFFSVYFRHFADSSSSTVDISSMPRTRSSRMSPRRLSTSVVVSLPYSFRRGLDSQAVRSLPVYRYTKAAKQRNEDCVICLSDFEEGETVKVIPHCGHVFHVDCVDTWLSSYVTCPLCRSNQLFSDKDLGMQEPPDQDSAEEHDTCDGVDTCVRRCSSCSSLGQRTGLERSLSL
ncbi:Zinc finger RING-type [Arabidopsis suecica]|uniref:RING-type E3 ubiquitin transferase n=1 Tax=Arabidopsis suecica TaxID=45249 RepID=A0A8T2G6F3_ARASU|nr:Zinc finger RING-type [Arabidopsis suecica]